MVPEPSSSKPADDRLSLTLAALADPTRRALLARLTAGDASVAELAKPFDIGVRAVSKHLTVLERAGLVGRRRDGQRRPSHIQVAPLQEVHAWIERYRRLWDARFARIDALLETLQEKDMMIDPMIVRPDDVSYTITRIFKAPRELVFKVWTDPKHVAQWWGVEGSTSTVHEFDVRPGGAMNIDMRTSDGDVYPNRGVFLDVVENTRLVFADVADATASCDGESKPIGVHTTTFEDYGGQTKVTIQSRFSSIADRDKMLSFGAVHGINQSLDRLERLLSDVVTSGSVR